MQECFLPAQSPYLINNLLPSITTANYPDVMMPSYNEHRVVALFFISFMVLSFFYIMNLVLAVTVNAYDESIGSRKQSRSEMSQRLLIEAFGLLDSGGGSVSRASIMHVSPIVCSWYF